MEASDLPADKRESAVVVVLLALLGYGTRVSGAEPLVVEPTSEDYG